MDLGRKHQPDYWIIVICSILLAVGVVIIYAIGPALKVTTNLSGSYYTSRQILAIVLSIVAFTLTAKIPISKWRQYSKWLVVFALGATFLAIILPVNPAYPAHRWVRFGSISFQSIELVKFAAVIWLAGFFARAIKNNTIKDFGKTYKPLLILLLITGVLIAGVQSDLGSTAVLIAMMVIMAFVAGFPLKRIFALGGVIVILLILAIIIFPYRRARIESYLHPSSNCSSASGYQACQALIAVGSGGIFGLGLGHSVQAYGYEPEASNDSIFAIYAETFGFIGSVALVGLFLALFNRFKNVAENIDDEFSQLLIIGIIAWLGTQTLINVGAMVGILPLKGITLPFVSYGGTSIVFSAGAVGLVFQLSGYTKRNSLSQNDNNKRRIAYEGGTYGRRIGRSRNPDLSNSQELEEK
jgi:cell division protein FtsW